ncbi:replicative DNA helicase [Tumidithrix elongata RA019]|uniref:Replicative DNA helicase n=1 Tax=Tumidithrix elongata BACA0141 TaxID=2716417 RepID=A0AAW9PVS6_9CYAN|nr:replicative DNA helicase [Tumidithrix elongata RA019]
MSNEFESASDRLPPQNIEAEEAILGGILMDPEAISRVMDLLRPEMFYVAAHQEIYRACLMLHNQSNPTDMMSVTTWLSDRDTLEKVGGQSKIVQLCDRTVSAVNVDYYAQLVVDKFTRRRLGEAGRATVDISFNSEMELSQALDLAEQKIFAVTQARTQQGLIPAGDILTKTFYELENRFNALGSASTSLPGLATGFYDFDAMTNGLQRSDLIIIAGRPSMGKCLAFDSELVLADGSIKTIETIYQQYQQNQTKPSLLTLGENWHFHLTQPSAFIDDGIKPVFRVTTALGREIETTLTHPFLTITGWQPLSKLCVGDKIALPRRIEVFGKEVQRSCEIKLLAYLLGDGCLTQTSPRFMNINSKIQDDFITAIEQFSPNLKVTIDTHGDRTATLHITAQKRGAGNPLIQWLRNLEVWGKKAHHKTIPDCIFRLEKKLIALFLNRLLATDGWMSILSSGQVQAGYATVSAKLARQVQHLLLRFGVIAKLKHKQVKYKQELRHCWQLDITDALSLQTLINEIGIFGKEDATNKAQLALVTKRYQTNTDLIPVEVWHDLTLVKGDLSWKKLAETAGINSSNIHVGKRAPTREKLLKLAKAVNCLSLQNLATSDIYWDKITAIKIVGEKQVYDLTIPETHNFVANDICVHNTAFGVEVARKMAENHKLPIAIFSLEMSKEQLVYRLLSSQSKSKVTDIGIDSNRLRSGQISENEWATVAMAISTLSDLPIFIDDTPNPSVTELRSKARRLQAEKGGVLGLILIDYLQLMEGSGSDNRVQELSRITRSLKALARELQVPVIALSQLSRGVEARTNKRPMLSDLRESGCLSGDSLVTMADTGEEIPIRDLEGKSGFAIWAVNTETMQMERAIASNAFCTGTKPVWALTTNLGRSIKATANHKFLTIQGWKRLDEFKVGDRLAMSCQNLSPQTPEAIARLATKDIAWEKIEKIDFLGEEMVYDLTVPTLENFSSQGFYAHNSIEQDADLVINLYRDEYYNPDTPDRGIAEIIIAKHRNGPVGTVKLLFEPRLTKFENMASR